MKSRVQNDQREDLVDRIRLGTLMALEEQTTINIKRPLHQHKQHGRIVKLQEPTDLQGKDTRLLNLSIIKLQFIHYMSVVDKFHIKVK